MKDVYKKREFCKAIKCPTQTSLDLTNKHACEEPRDYLGGKSVKERLVENTKKYCQETCFAWKFHDWLQKNGYAIVKEDQIKKIEEVIENADDLREALVDMYHSSYPEKQPFRMKEIGDSCFFGLLGILKQVMNIR